MATPDDLAVLIDAVRENQNQETIGELLHALKGSELYYRASVVDSGEGQQVTAPLARLSDGSHALVVYTSKSHPDLPRKFGGAHWRHVLRMAVGIPEVDWLIVSAGNEKWVPVNRQQIESLLKDMQSADQGMVSVDSAASRLEDLISQVEDSSSGTWSELLEGLPGSELFLRISDEPSKDGRPVLITSEAGGVHGLVQAYTSRSRPAMTYGGMKWEAVVNMIRSAPDIPGVQIINENDDWVVLGRSEI